MSSEVKRYGPTSDGMIFGQQHLLIGEKTDGDFVRYEDYAALEAENGQIGRTLYERNNELCACELERDAARAQLAAIQGGMGEVVGFDRNAAYAACPESGCDWGSFYVGWKAAAAQHLRILAQHRQQAGKLVEALRKIHFRADCFVEDDMDMRVPSIKAIVRIAGEALAARDVKP